jgi:nucleotide-binding universal stress UspA family protein
MTPHAIISYDDTPNDQDALVLGQLLANAGTRLTLAYVSHQPEADEHAAWDLLERGALWLDDVPYHVDRRVIVSASTGEGLKWLALHERADMIVFGSDYRTATGHVAPGRSAQTLLEGGPAALAIAPADYRERGDEPIRTIGLLADPGDDATLETARELAGVLDATVTRDEPRVGLLVVGSRSEAPHGHVLITAAAANAVENAKCPVLIVARGVPIEFGSLVGA